MSDARRIDRKKLFDLFRRKAEAPPTSTEDTTSAFSLEQFYVARDRDGDGDGADGFPRFVLRDGLPLVETVAAYAEPIGPGKKGPT